MGVDARMLIGLPLVPEPRRVQRWGYELGEAVGPESFLIDHIGDRVFGEPYRALMLEKPSDGTPDSFSLIDDIGEVERAKSIAFLRVSLMGRYYGPRYERGNLWTYIAVAEWAERNIAGARVYYGGDSDNQLKPFDSAGREALIRHWAANGGRPYQEYFNQSHPLRPTCPQCDEPACQFGSGGNYASWSCLGCGQGWTWVGGDVVPRHPRRNGFEHASELRGEETGGNQAAMEPAQATAASAAQK